MQILKTGNRTFNTADLSGLITDRQPPGCKLAHQFRLCPGLCFHHPYPITDHGQRTSGHHCGIKLTDGTGSRITGVGKGRFPPFFTLLVQLLKGGQRQVDLATHLKQGRQIVPGQTQRHIADCTDVGGHLFTDLAIPTG